MTGLWQSHHDLDADIAPCQRCGTDVVLQHQPPCPHGYVACDGCGHPSVCIQCAANNILGPAPTTRPRIHPQQEEADNRRIEQAERDRDFQRTYGDGR